MKRIQIIVLLALILILGGAFYWLTKDNEVSVVQEDKTTLSPTQVESIENIGQWEFLSVSDEELIDTIRRGFWGDDQLVRIYYGTLRLGIDMKDVKKGWLQASQDSIVCTLPPIKLLDHNFIDEAKTKSFFEEGKWTGSDRQAMYERAYQAMKKRCLNRTNIYTAQANAKTQFREMLKAMGFKNSSRTTPNSPRKSKHKSQKHSKINTNKRFVRETNKIAKGLRRTHFTYKTRQNSRNSDVFF